MRKFLSVVFGILALLAALFLFVALGEENSANRTIESSRKIESGFRNAANYINDFRNSHGRLPTKAEFSEWALRFSDGVDSPRYFQWDGELVPKEVIDKFGPAPKDRYVISYWRGEWMEYYASWADRSTVILDRRAYYILGSEFADVVLMLVITALLVALAIIIWPKRERLPWDLR